MNNEFPVLDGIAPSWADIRVRAKGADTNLIDIVDIKSIDTGVEVSIGEQEGASGGRVLKRTTGAVKNTAKMVLYRTGYQKLLRAMMVNAPTRGGQRIIGVMHMGIQVFFTPPGDVEIYEYRIKGCRLLGRTLNSAQGTDAAEVEVPLSPSEIVDIIDGKEVVFL